MVLLIGSILLFRLVWIQVKWGDELRATARIQTRSRQVIMPERGIIFDITGVPVTNSLRDYVSLGINPSRVTDPERLARELSRVTGRSTETYRKLLSRSSSYAVLVRKASPEQADRIERMGWKLDRQPDPKRAYPHGTLLSQILGYINIDDIGIQGIEQMYDNVLRGDPGWRVVRLDVRGNPHLRQSLPFKKPVNGGDVILTTEIPLQSVLEDELIRAIDEYHAISASGIILDPRNGAISALASIPSYDPNQLNASHDSSRKCRIITDVYEPGSTFKLIPASLLLERGLADSHTTIDCKPGYVVIYGKKIRDTKAYDKLTFKQGFAKSSNVVMIKLSERLDGEDFYQHICKFGFIGRTGVELDGEVAGFMPKPEDWSGTTKPNLVIGQGIAVTILQMAMAYATVANGGQAVTPALVHGIRHPDGRFVKRDCISLRRVISEKTAAVLSDFLVETVNNGTGQAAKINGLTIAGKTGTAEKPNLIEGGYYDDRLIASFIGFFPAEDPAYLVAIIVDEPNGKHTGGLVAAPVFRRVAKRILGLKPEIRMQQTNSTNDKHGSSVRVPDITMLKKDEARRKLEDCGLSVRFHGKGTITLDQVPFPGMLSTVGVTVETTLGQAGQQQGGGVVVPVFANLSLRDAILKATEAGLTVKITGFGRVVRQSIPSGSRVPVGEVCKLEANG